MGREEQAMPAVGQFYYRRRYRRFEGARWAVIAVTSTHVTIQRRSRRGSSERRSALLVVTMERFRSEWRHVDLGIGPA